MRKNLHLCLPSFRFLRRPLILIGRFYLFYNRLQMSPSLGSYIWDFYSFTSFMLMGYSDQPFGSFSDGFLVRIRRCAGCRTEILTHFHRWWQSTYKRVASDSLQFGPRIFSFTICRIFGYVLLSYRAPNPARYAWVPSIDSWGCDAIR